jgi:hypothetical protein
MAGYDGPDEGYISHSRILITDNIDITAEENRRLKQAYGQVKWKNHIGWAKRIDRDTRKLKFPTALGEDESDLINDISSVVY